jgi:peptidyl-prolyl cis-trans isomerase SurA
MTFLEFRQSTAILILSASLGSVPLGSVPVFAQAGNAPAAKGATDTPPIAGKVVEDIVARVNDQIVTQSDYDRAAEGLEQEAQRQAVPQRELDQKKADLLRDLIDQQLLLSKGKELGITGETELIKRLDELRKQNHLDSMEALEKAYTEQQTGSSFEDFKASLRNSIITQQVVRDEVGRRIQMSPAEIQNYYKTHESEFTQPESVTLNEILIPTPGKSATEPADASQVAAAQAKADAIMAKLATGAKFEDQAKADPADPNAPKYVVLGEFRRGSLGKGIEEKAFALNAGQYTQPIQTKQGFIILQATEHNRGGDEGFKKAEPQVEEALFMEQMQPKLREYLTKLREEAYVEIKPGAVDTGASGNEMRLSYSAYTPPAPKKKQKFQRTRFRGRDRSRTVKTAAAPSTSAATTATAATAAPSTGATAAKTAAATTTTQQASNEGTQKPGKREKIRFGQAPRESLPASQVATNVPPDNTPGVTTPETRVVNPDGTISGEVAPVSEKKTRLSNRPSVKKVKGEKSSDAPPPATAEELASQKVQSAPLGLADPNVKKTKQKGEKTRLANKPQDTTQPAPYLGKPEGSQAPAPTSGPSSTAPVEHPAPADNPPAPATGPPDPIPPGAQQP